MIARHETHMDKMDIWSKLSAPLPSGVISWRQDGKPLQRDGKYVARFVAYIDANTVRERLDSVVPGEWDLTLELLPTLAGQDENGEQVAKRETKTSKQKLASPAQAHPGRASTFHGQVLSPPVLRFGSFGGERLSLSGKGV